MSAHFCAAGCCHFSRAIAVWSARVIFMPAWSAGRPSIIWLPDLPVGGQQAYYAHCGWQTHRCNRAARWNGPSCGISERWAGTGQHILSTPFHEMSSSSDHRDGTLLTTTIPNIIRRRIDLFLAAAVALHSVIHRLSVRGMETPPFFLIIFPVERHNHPRFARVGSQIRNISQIFEAPKCELWGQDIILNKVFLLRRSLNRYILSAMLIHLIPGDWSHYRAVDGVLYMHQNLPRQRLVIMIKV